MKRNWVREMNGNSSGICCILLLLVKFCLGMIHQILLLKRKGISWGEVRYSTSCLGVIIFNYYEGLLVFGFYYISYCKNITNKLNNV